MLKAFLTFDSNNDETERETERVTTTKKRYIGVVILHNTVVTDSVSKPDV